MSRSQKDNLKRQVAQVIGHQSATIMAANSLYETFAGTHPKEAETLLLILGVEIRARETMVKFAFDAWALDEERIMSYL